jgi:hypothetical protein
MLLIGAALFGVVLLMVGTVVAVLALREKIAREDAAANVPKSERTVVKSKDADAAGSRFPVNHPESHPVAPKGAPAKTK